MLSKLLGAFVFAFLASLLGSEAVAEPMLYRLGTGPGGASTLVSLMSRDASSFLVTISSGPGAGKLYFSRQSLELSQPGIYVNWPKFGAAIAPGVSGGTQFYGTYSPTATSYTAAYSSLSGAATTFTLQGGSVALAKSSFVDGNSAENSQFVAIGNSQATGFDRPWIYRPGGGGAPFAYLDLPATYFNALALKVSDDGRYTFGYAYKNGSVRLIVWDGTSILTDAAYPAGLALADVNTDGSLAVAVSNNQPILIARDGTVTNLGSVPGGGTIVSSGISGDGELAIGNSTFGLGGWVWTPEDGIVTGSNYFASVLNPGEIITRLDFVSQDGKTFAGQLSSPTGLQAFVLTDWSVPTPATGVIVLLSTALISLRRSTKQG